MEENKLKKEKIENLFCKISQCDKCKYIRNKNGIDCSLINIFKNEKLYKNIPSIWTDWYRRLDSKIMIIGQDWGPYIEMKKIHEKYMKNPNTENWNNIIEEEKSITKKMLTKYLIKSSDKAGIKINEKFLNNIYITNGILCARKGESYRGDNINLKKSSLNCKDYLKEQIDIIKPKIILTLGYYPLFELSNIYNFSIGKTLKENIDKEIRVDNFVILPLYHPAAQVSEEKQLNCYFKIWKYY